MQDKQQSIGDEWAVIGIFVSLMMLTLHLIRPELRREIRPVRVKLLKDAPLRLLSITRTRIE